VVILKKFVFSTFNYKILNFLEHSFIVIDSQKFAFFTIKGVCNTFIMKISRLSDHKDYDSHYNW